METYIIIEGFENYSVSDFGNVRNNRTGRILKPRFDSHGYYRINLYQQKIMQVVKIHQLAAKAFLQNLENKRNVDHIDNNKTNNNLINLRWATSTENGQNATMSKRNTSGSKGVSLKKNTQKWQAYIQIDGIPIHLGYFDNLEDAKQARITKANEAFGVFVNKCEKLI